MGILFPWFLFYLSVRLYKSELLRKPLGRVQTYVRHVHHAEEPWPRITGSITVPFDHTLGWAGARRFFADPPVLMTGIVILVVLGFFLFDFIFIFFILGVALMLVAIAVHRASHRKRVFVSLFPYALDTLIQALRTGYSFRQAITLVRQETEQPIHEVFAALERGFEYRIPQREVLLALQGELRLPGIILLTPCLFKKKPVVTASLYLNRSPIRCVSMLRLSVSFIRPRLQEGFQVYLLPCLFLLFLYSFLFSIPRM